MLYRITNPNILKNFKTITKSDEFYYSLSLKNIEQSI